MPLPTMNSAGDACCDACLTPPCGVCDGDCYLQIDCYSRSRAGQKCGFFWTEVGYENDARFAQVVLLFWGSRSVTWTGDGCPENEEYSIGNGEGNPLRETWTIGGTRIDTYPEGIWRGCPDASPLYSPCDTDCAIANDGGNIAHYDDGTNIYDGTELTCVEPEPDPQITIEGMQVDQILWENDSPPPDDFFFNYVDPNIPLADIPVWTLEPGDTLPLHGRWTKSWDLTYNDGTYGGSSEDCVVNTVGEWFCDITASDEITTNELIDEITDFVLTDADFDEHTMDNACPACFSIAANESGAYFRQTIVKFTNTSATDTVQVSWNVNTRAAAFSEDPAECGELCTDIGGAPDTTDPETETLLPLAEFERTLTPDTSGSGQTVWISDITCVVVP